MRVDAVEVRSSQSDERNFDEQASEQGRMTRARRAALAALEREFRDLLQADPLAASG